MTEPLIEIFDRNREPSTAKLESLCDLFQRNIPVFDQMNEDENPGIVAERATPENYRKLLETKTLLLVCEAHDKVSGLLEWDPRDRNDFMLAYITWIMVDKKSRGQRLSSKLHTSFEQDCIPGVVATAQKTVLQGLSVHLKNPAVEIYQKWGYTPPDEPQWNDDRRLFMIKPAATESTF